MIKTKIFLDSGNPEETKEVLDILGFLDGQTTNPSLVSKHPSLKECLGDRKQCTERDVLTVYKNIIGEIHALIPDGSISIEVYADKNTSAEEMIAEAREMNQWIDSAYIKLPITKEGLKAAETISKEGIRLNMTLCFSGEQAAAVHSATRGAKDGSVYVSPFIGRLDDRGENGVDLVRNIAQMYQKYGSHVKVLSASIRTLEHLISSFEASADIVTAPLKVLKEWEEKGEPEFLDEDKKKSNFKEIPYVEIDADKSYTEYNIQHDLTDSGLQKFADDWNKLISLKRQV